MNHIHVSYAQSSAHCMTRTDHGPPRSTERSDQICLAPCIFGTIYAQHQDPKCFVYAKTLEL